MALQDRRQAQVSRHRYVTHQTDKTRILEDGTLERFQYSWWEGNGEILCRSSYERGEFPIDYKEEWVKCGKVLLSGRGT